MENKKLFLAADSGGSKTEWVIIDQTGSIIKSIKTKGLGAIREGILPVKDIIKEAFDCLNQFQNIEYLYLSLGGPNVSEVETYLKEFWPCCTVKVEREANGNAMLNAAKMMNCDAVVMCGTGSVAMGETNEGRKYCGGWGPVYGDEGSGGGLCTQALRTFLRSLDGLEPDSCLREIFSEIISGLDLKNFEQRMEAKKRAVELDRRTLASFTTKIYEAAISGDKVALQLYDNAAKEIADMAFSVSDNTKSTKIIICGGFLSNSPFLLEKIKEYFSYISDATIVYNPHFCPIVAAKVAVLQMGSVDVDSTLFEKLLNF